VKCYIVYTSKEYGWMPAHLIREDGACLATHLCSEPGYMPGDLYDHRPERKEKLGAVELDRNPYYVEDFEKMFPEVFALAFEKVTT
jgi:hypothetical protein